MKSVIRREVIEAETGVVTKLYLTRDGQWTETLAKARVFHTVVFCAMEAVKHSGATVVAVAHKDGK